MSDRAYTMRTLQGRISAQAAEGHFRIRWIVFVAVLLMATASTARAQKGLRFDTFLGYGNTVKEGNWFPLVVEVENLEQGFTGAIEITSGSFSDQEVRRTTVELPTGTTKRLSIPVFAHGGRTANWRVRVVDENGKVRASNDNLAVTVVSGQTAVFGAVAQSPSGAPSFPKIAVDRREYQPVVEVFSRTTFPIGVLELEGLNGIYVNSSRLVDFSPPQIDALAAWFESGGHLILAVDQPSDLAAAPWLRRFLPVNISSVENVEVGGGIYDFIKSKPNISSFQDDRVRRWESKLDTLEAHWSMTREELTGSMLTAPLPINDMVPSDDLIKAEVSLATGFQRSGEVLLSFSEKPAIIRSSIGRAKITMLLFNPEREPFRSWEHRDWFWAKLLGVPARLFSMPQFGYEQTQSVDGVFGAMIDSRQVRKLPIEWLLALLILYLVVIGPFDHYVLKKANRQILTWITFPAYVALFSCGIYWIGYKLRAGDSEVTTINVVDVTPGGYDAKLRGRSYLSIYSPVNQTYPLVVEEMVSSVRNETGGSMSGGASNESRIDQLPNGFRAGAFVPVWTSQLYLSDWVTQGPNILGASLKQSGQSWTISITNHLAVPLGEAKVVFKGRVSDVGVIEPNGSRRVSVGPNAGTKIGQLIAPRENEFFSVIQSRGTGFGDTRRGQLAPNLDNALAASFISESSHLRPDDTGGFSIIPNQSNNQQWRNRIVAPSGMDLTRESLEGNAIIFAWIEDYSPIPPIEDFTPSEEKQYSLVRMVVPVSE